MRDKVGKRYVLFINRTFADPQGPADAKQINLLQDAIRVEQATTGSFEVPNWDRRRRK